MKNLFLLVLASLALSACAGLYETGQQYSRAQCQKASSPTSSDCARRDGTSYEDYQKEREKARGGAQ
ncbi:hypothetical protein [Azohydromonas aeria]|uniref:hypothetical protein n=1 Tax=Azohydromonas aeria TaxID=2590212 RepID=UPI0012F94B4D|nr:hypothetical protein [Azohydromonas aeria]